MAGATVAAVAAGLATGAVVTHVEPNDATHPWHAVSGALPVLLPVEVEVEKRVEVPVVQRVRVEVPVEVPVERVVEKRVEVPAETLQCPGGFVAWDQRRGGGEWAYCEDGARPAGAR